MSAKKSRFDGLDVAAMTSHLKRTILGYKLANVYDGSALGATSSDKAARGVYMFKLADPSSSAPSSAGNQSSNIENETQESNADGAGDHLTSATATNAADTKRVMLLIESGVRFHPTTHYSQSSPGSSSMPSNFAMKLRKHLRNLRLENVTQLGNLDRVVDFRFGSGNYAHHLLLELYAQGNLILTDGNYRILALLRTHEYEVVKNEEGDVENDNNNDNKIDGSKNEEVKVRVGNVYPVTFATTLSVDREEGSVGGDLSYRKDYGGGGGDASKGILSMDSSEAYKWAKAELFAVHEKAMLVTENQSSDNDVGKAKKGGKMKGGGGGGGGGGGKKKTMDESLVLKALLLKPASGVYHYGPSLIEHCIRSAGIDPVVKLTHDNIEYTLPESSWHDIITSLRDEGSRVIQNLSSGENGGFILYKPKETDGKDEKKKKDDNHDNNSLITFNAANTTNPHSDKTLLEFQPHLLQQHKDQQCLRYSTFAIATDEFFSHLSSQKVAHRADAAEAAARERLSKIQADQQRRVEGLVKEQERWREGAQLVELHAEDIDRALGVINSALQTGMDWEALEQLVSVEQANQNPIALLIHKLELEKNHVVMALPDLDAWDDSDPDSLPPIHHVTVSIKESAYGNARTMFAQYRASKEKEEKTMEASTVALKAAEAKAKLQLVEAQKQKQRVQVLPQRKVYWFEKFAWFITSDNYLVVAGKDAQQNEQLVKRYLRPGDAYLHAEVHGAATCILRAKRRRRRDGRTQVIPLSDQALREAGTFTICRSSAWSSKMVTSAYWVESHQVSKTAPSGEYLTVGSFMIRGRKNFLPASSLEMGLGVLFRLGDDASVARHANERRDFALLEQEEMMAKEDKITPEPEDDANSEPIEEDEYSSATQQLGEEINDTPQHEVDKDLSEKMEVINVSDDDYEVSQSKNEKSVTFQKNNPPPKNDTKKEKELSRGKRLKNRRAKKKYADQDEEDRQLAMMALQGGESSKKGKKKGSKIIPEDSETQQKAEQAAKQLLVRDPKKIAENLDESVRNILASCVTVKVTKGSEGVRWNKFDAEVLELLLEMESLEQQRAAASRLLELTNSTRVDNFSGSLAGIIRTIKKHGINFKDGNASQVDGKQRKTKAEKKAEKEAWQEILAEDGIVDTDGDDDLAGAVDDSAELSKLTGKPTSEDVILHAIPVVAPYQVISQYKYRVKLTPGSVKRGKASKQCVEMFTRNEEGKKKSVDEGTRRDKELIKLVGENEWVQAMIGDVRITSAGASKVVKKQKGKGTSRSDT